MLTEVYEPRWVNADVDGVPVRAITFAVNRSHPRYTKALSLHEMARMINTGAGALGTCREYFDATLQKLETLGIRAGQAIFGGILIAALALLAAPILIPLIRYIRLLI